MQWLPNLLTCVRIALTPFIIQAILGSDGRRALLLCVIAGATDGIDGLIARRFGWVTRSGAYLDPVADKLLLTSVYLSFGAAGVVPAWLVWAVVGRDVLILSLVTAGFLLTSVRDFPPSIWGKVSTVIQVGAALLLLGLQAGVGLPQQIQQLAVWTVLIGTVISGGNYLWRAACIFRMRRASSGRTQSV